MLVEYISPEDLEYMAMDALSGFERKHGTIQKWPVPLDQFIESHLGLTIYFCHMEPEILGCLNVKDRIVFINENLDTFRRPQNEGRCNFTIAHEGGHEIAHAPKIRAMAEMRDLFGKQTESNTTILCRNGDQGIKIEFQANYIGAATLMPKKLIHVFWKDHFGDLRQRDEQALLYKIRLDEDFATRVERIRGNQSDAALLEEYFRPIAKEFTVSPEAFCHRLRTLGLLGNNNNRELFAHVSM